MVTISPDRLNALISKWEKSSGGKARIQAYVNGLVGRGSGRTVGGSTYVGRDDMIMAAREMVEYVKSSASDAGLPASVIANINSLTYTEPYDDGNGNIRIDLYFADRSNGSLGRPSLYEEGYPEGVGNIIALFNNGYNAKNYVYGWWDNHTASLESSVDTKYRSGISTSSVYIRSKLNREATLFMQGAVRRFNEKHKESITAVLNSSEYSPSEEE
jgi:hypothetical protein